VWRLIVFPFRNVATLRAEDEAPDSITRNAAFSLASQMTTAAVTAVLTVFLVRALGPGSYGLFALALSINAILLLLADFGISSSTARFAAERRARRWLLSPLIVDAVKLKLVVAALAAVLLMLFADPIASAYGEPGLAWPLRGMALATFGQSLMLMASGIFTALGRVAVRYRVVLAESVTEASASVALVLLGGGAAGAAFGRAGGYLLGGFLGLALAVRLVGGSWAHIQARPDAGTVRRVARYASSLLVVDAAYTLSASANVLLLGAYLGTYASGIYAAPARLMILLRYPGLSIANAVGPRLSRGPDQEPDVHALGLALRGLILFQCLLVAPMVAWAAPISDLVLGSGYAESAHVLAALSPYLLFTGPAPLVTIGVNYAGEARRRMPIALLSLAVWVGSAAVLIPNMGVVGAAIAADLGLGLYTLGHLRLCRRLFALRLAPLGTSLLRGLVAAAAMTVVLLAIGIGDLTAVQWLAGALLGPIAYLGALISTGEITPYELTRFAGVVRRGVVRFRGQPGATQRRTASGQSPVL
jgi:O-antigen/teichoic acid export membrane protein